MAKKTHTKQSAEPKKQMLATVYEVDNHGKPVRELYLPSFDPSTPEGKRMNDVLDALAQSINKADKATPERHHEASIERAFAKMNQAVLEALPRTTNPKTPKDGNP